MDPLLTGTVAVVSGVGPGLGRATALALAREGATVGLLARDRDRLESVQREIESTGAAAVVVPTDVSDPDACRGAIERVVAECGGIDVLVHSAFRGDPNVAVADVDLDRWRQVYDVNVIGGLQLVDAAVPHLRQRGGASVVFVSSMSARKVEPRRGGYASSKAALIAAAQALAPELGADGIRVNTVVPGWIRGPSVERYVVRQAEQRGVPIDSVVAEIVADIPLGAMPDDAAVAEAIVFFASGLSGAITGQALDVNGGEYFGSP